MKKELFTLPSFENDLKQKEVFLLFLPGFCFCIFLMEGHFFQSQPVGKPEHSCLYAHRPGKFSSILIMSSKSFPAESCRWLNLSSLPCAILQALCLLGFFGFFFQEIGRSKVQQCGDAGKSGQSQTSLEHGKVWSCSSWKATVHHMLQKWIITSDLCKCLQFSQACHPSNPHLFFFFFWWQSCNHQLDENFLSKTSCLKAKTSQQTSKIKVGNKNFFIVTDAVKELNPLQAAFPTPTSFFHLDLPVPSQKWFWLSFFFLLT